MKRVKQWPPFFYVTAAMTGLIAILMSLIPPLIYIGMAPDLKWHSFFEALLLRSVPILLLFGVTLAAALKIGPTKHMLTGASLLTATIPCSIALMIWGLR